jgi:AcrR family transcriptional regulator
LSLSTQLRPVFAALHNPGDSVTVVTLSLSSKVESRRQQILDAACACVRRAGFHGASMAEIAKAAGLSVGQIYRYFKNKEAIVAAIVAQDLAEMHAKFAELESSDSPLMQAMIDGVGMGVERNYEPERAALMLEVLAEAARNPRVAAILREADAAERALGYALLEKVMPAHCSAEDMAARGEVLGMLFDGMVMRAVSNPDSDRKAIARMVGMLMRNLLEAPPMLPTEA